MNYLKAFPTALLCVSGAIVAAMPAVPAHAAACTISPDRKQVYSGFSYETVAHGFKVTCNSTLGRRYAIVIVCDPNDGDNYTRHGATVSSPNTSRVLCNAINPLQLAYTRPDPVTNVYIRYY